MTALETDCFELSDLSLDDAMIEYAYYGYGMVYLEHPWKEFKEYYNCQETPTALFDRFWDDIVPNLNNYEKIQNTPAIAMIISRIHNPRIYPPRRPRNYDNVDEISLFAFEQQQNKAIQEKIFNDPKMLALKANCHDYINNLSGEQDIPMESPNPPSSSQQSTTRQSNRQLSSHSQMSRGTQRRRRASRDSSDGEPPSRRRRSADVE
ncbi:uncharacterized protein LOC119085768 isoform X2 [Bradysia coprophila]|uniref:uncharacterized protein LOC119085768 isoform X2 n=1 Tax=Bradysia coprophila TaxID=38358 RepID=UPI00187DBC50|nr:uncharacterized protein LOC119085768 isoform X2 [Bradysia coprophila]